MAAKPRFVYLQIAAITLFWGLNWPAMKMAVGEMSPWVFRSISVTGAGLTLLALAKLTGESLVVPRRSILPLVLTAMTLTAGWHMLTAFALTTIGGGRASIIAFTMPTWAAMLSAIFLKEKISARHIGGLVLGMAGLGLLMGRDIMVFGETPLGALLMVAAALVWAIQTVAFKGIQWNMAVLPLTGWQLIVASVPIITCWSIFEGEADFSKTGFWGWFALGYVVFVALTFCFSSYVRLIMVLPAAIAAISTIIIPAVGVTSSALLLGEQIQLTDLSALACVIASLSLVLWPKKNADA